MLGLTGGGRTRLCEPQTCCRPSSRQPCATRPRKRELGPCALDPLLRNQNHTHGKVELPLDQRTTVQRHRRVGTRPSQPTPRHPRVGGDPVHCLIPLWIPAYAGMTGEALVPGNGHGMPCPYAERGRCTDQYPPSARASSAGLAGNRTAACLRSAATSSAGPRQAEQRSEPEGPCSWGGLSFGYFSLAKQRKVTRQEGEKRRCSMQRNYPATQTALVG